jgi:hypothetical protein
LKEFVAASASADAERVLPVVDSVPPVLLDLMLDLLEAHGVGPEGVPVPQFWSALQVWVTSTTSPPS